MVLGLASWWKLRVSDTNDDVIILTSEQNTANKLVATDVVEVHDHDVQRALPDLLPGNVEAEVLIEHGVQGALEDGGLALLYPLVSEL